MTRYSKEKSLEHRERIRQLLIIRPSLSILKIQDILQNSPTPLKLTGNYIGKLIRKINIENIHALKKESVDGLIGNFKKRTEFLQENLYKVITAPDIYVKKITIGGKEKEILITTTWKDRVSAALAIQKSEEKLLERLIFGLTGKESERPVINDNRQININQIVKTDEEFEKEREKTCKKLNKLQQELEKYRISGKPQGGERIIDAVISEGESSIQDDASNNGGVHK